VEDEARREFRDRLVAGQGGRRERHTSWSPPKPMQVASEVEPRVAPAQVIEDPASCRPTMSGPPPVSNHATARRCRPTVTSTKGRAWSIVRSVTAAPHR
jgi:hypothetical protein